MTDTPITSREAPSQSDTIALRALSYPARYYGVYDPSAPRPVQVTGWFDLWRTDYPESLIPEKEHLFALTPEQWAWHLDGHSQAQIGTDNTLADYVSPPLPPLPLSQRAENALSDVQSQAAMIVAMGESFGPETKSYVQALQAIIKGTDTTSTELPAKPDDLTS